MCSFSFYVCKHHYPTYFKLKSSVCVWYQENQSPDAPVNYPWCFCFTSLGWLFLACRSCTFCLCFGYCLSLLAPLSPNNALYFQKSFKGDCWSIINKILNLLPWSKLRLNPIYRPVNWDKVTHLAGPQGRKQKIGILLCYPVLITTRYGPRCKPLLNLCCNK